MQKLLFFYFFTLKLFLALAAVSGQVGFNIHKGKTKVIKIKEARTEAVILAESLPLPPSLTSREEQTLMSNRQQAKQELDS